jgi:hypothetical protein
MWPYPDNEESRGEALYHAVSPPPLRSAERMANRFASLFRFWDVLQGPRYVYRLPGIH